MTNNNDKNKKGKRIKNTETTTFIPPSVNERGTTLTAGIEQTVITYEYIKKVAELETKITLMEKSIKDTNSNLQSIRKKENRLLNRFGWTLIMANILLGALSGIIIFLFADFVYPFLENALRDHQGQFWIITTIAALILGGICGLWIKVTQFAIYVKNRDQKEN